MNDALGPAKDVTAIVLAGFMGSGKTTVGRLLGRELGWRFSDLDDLVEARCGLKIPDIFASVGEPTFRRAELDALRQALNDRHVVLALGGGTPGTAEVRELLAASSGIRVVYLQAPFPVLYDRCRAQARDPQATFRPLLGNSAEAKDRFEQRAETYARIAHCTVDAGLEDPVRIAQSILRALDSAPSSQGNR